MALFDLFRHSPADTVSAPAPRQRPHRKTIRQARYDFADERNPAGGQKRRPSRIETTGEDGILTPSLRYRAINLARDAQRNYPSMASWLNTVQVSVIGDAGKLKFNATDPWLMDAAKWFNRRWSKHCDFRDGSTWRETLQAIVSAIMREGDLVVQFDGGALTDSGRLVLWESDQITNLTDEAFAPYAAQGYTQTQGIVKDRFGRICGAIVTNVRGAQSVPADKAFVLMSDPDHLDDADWRLVRRKWRCVQDRGASMALPAITGVVDSAEILAYELLTAKQAAARYAAVTESAEDAGVEIPPGFDGLPTGADTTGNADTVSPGTTAEEDEELGHALGLERFCGGNVDYLPHGASIAFDPANRPNSNLPAFLDFQARYNGGTLGLVGSLATNQITSSYSGFRGEVVLSWMTFRSHQQWLEDTLLDWVARRVIAWAIDHGQLDAPPAELEWSDYIAWTYPTCPQIDGSKEQDALAKKLRNGLTSYREELGADWRERLQELADELAFAKSIGLTSLSVFDGAPPSDALPAEPTNTPDE